LSPIDCEQALKDIELYLDGQLSEPMRSEVRSHLHGCPPCLDRAEFQRRLRELVAARCGCDEVPNHLMERLRSVLRERGAS
jgi:mycothiol system anti-sigma-R factor